jgi:hypothetical protein
MPFKDTKEGQTNYCEACEQEAGGFGYKPGLKHTCKTNTLDKCEKYRHDFIYHEVNGIIDQRLCRKCNLNEKLPEKNWNNEPCGNKLCENCHPEIYSKVKPEGVGEWEEKLQPKVSITDHDGKYSQIQDIAQMLLNDYWEDLKPAISSLLLQEKAKWKGEIMTLINREIAIAHTKDKGGKTSRLTSLAMAVSKLLTSPS